MTFISSISKLVDMLMFLYWQVLPAYEPVCADAVGRGVMPPVSHTHMPSRRAAASGVRSGDGWGERNDGMR